LEEARLMMQTTPGWRSDFNAGRGGAVVWAYGNEPPQTYGQSPTRPRTPPHTTVAATVRDAVPNETEDAVSGSAFERLLLIEERSRAELRDAIANVTHPWAARLARRLDALFEATRESYPDEPLVSVASLRGFLRFLELEPRLRYPDITISPQGNLWAEWRAGRERHLAIEFLPAGEAKFAIFAPDPMQPMRIARIAGRLSLPAVFWALEPYQVQEWVCE
jgi:hypothetical protein